MNGLALVTTQGLPDHQLFDFRGQVRDIKRGVGYWTWDAERGLDGFADYEMSMASPAESADGREPTVPTVAATSTRIRHSFLAFEMPDHASDLEPCLNNVLVDIEPPPVKIVPTSSIVELFEGVVQSVTDEHMNVVLRAKRNLSTPDHAMSIELSNVQPQDRDLVSPGSVFYLTMFRETTGRTVRNVEEIRFRRQPDWTPAMFRKLEELASKL